MLENNDIEEVGKVYQFCCKAGKCPEVRVKGDRIELGGKEEGFTVWEKGHMQDFVAAAKRGDFDGIIAS